jgi:hypothetical protein
VAWARVSGGIDGGFIGSRRSLCVEFSFVAPWCHAAWIPFGLSGAFVRAAPGIYCGTRIQFHLARGQLRLRPTTIRVVPSCTWVASLLVRHDRRRGFGQVSASLHASLCTPLACKPVRALMLTVCSGWLAGRMVRAHYGMPCLGAVLHSPCDCTPMHFIYSGGSLCSAVNSVDARIACVACLLKCRAH